MGDTFVLGGLEARYAAKLGELRRFERESGKLRRELAKIGATIQLYRPEWSGADVKPIKPRKPSRWGGRGRGIRTALDVLREAQGPLTTNEIARRVLERLDMPVPPLKELRLILASFNGALTKRIGEGVICHAGPP
ncbi:MAG: hypothetical protein R3E09_03900 [Novosphingobium sp.]